MNVMLAKDYDGRDPVGLWISEKLDGVRALWNGKELLTRSGNRIDCPAWFTDGLPQIALDGELWAGRGQFQFAKGTCQSLGREEEWTHMMFMVFDAPGTGTFEERREVLRALSLPEQCKLVMHLYCMDADHLAANFASVKKANGEGLVLRIPGSPYLAGQRSAYWQKVKKSPELYKSTLAA